MSLNIPLPPDAATNFNNAVNSGSQLYSRIMQPIMQRRQLAQQAQFEQDRVAYQNQSLAIQRMEQARMAQTAAAQVNLINQQIAASKMKTDPNARLKYMTTLMNGLAQNPQFQQMYGGGQGQQAGAAQTTNANMGGTQPPAMFSGQGMPSPAMLGQQNNMPTQSPASSGMPQALQTGGGYNGPSAAAQAAMSFAGLPVIQTPQQKQQLAVGQASQIAQNAANQKRVTDIQQTAKSLMPIAQDYQKMQNIIDTDPSAVGPWANFKKKWGITNDPNTGIFANAALDLQSFKAHQNSSRGGYGLMKMYGAGKPDVPNSAAFNRGALENVRSQLQQSFDMMNADHKSLTKQDLPDQYNFQKFLTKTPLIHQMSEEDLRRIAGAK